jgi:hypothetical protein
MPQMIFTFDSDEEKSDFSKWLIESTAELDKLHPWRTIVNAAIANSGAESHSEPVMYLFVAGQEMASGFMHELSAKFDNELAAHSATVELREKIGDKWKTVRQRKSQI